MVTIAFTSRTKQLDTTLVLFIL